MNKYHLLIGCSLYVIGSLADILTTVHGLSLGFGEKTPTVRFLMTIFGDLGGIIVAKIIGLPIAAIVGYSIGEFELRGRVYKRIQAVEITIGVVGLYYLAVGIRNLLVLYV